MGILGHPEKAYTIGVATSVSALAATLSRPLPLFLSLSKSMLQQALPPIERSAGAVTAHCALICESTNDLLHTTLGRAGSTIDLAKRKDQAQPLGAPEPLAANMAAVRLYNVVGHRKA